jgi:hypothetical protein
MNTLTFIRKQQLQLEIIHELIKSLPKDALGQALLLRN